jgi:predicted permease
VILVALAILLSTAAGVACEARTPLAMRAAGISLTGMLYVLMPFVAYASFSHLHLSVGAAVGLVAAWIGLGAAGFLAWLIGRWMGMPRPSLGALICTVTIVNTGYVGFPLIVVLLGAHALTPAVAYDQVVSAPFFFTGGFALGALFGTGPTPSVGGRIRALLFRNPPLAGAVAGLLAPAALAPHVLIDVSRVVVDALIVPGFFAVGVYLSADRADGSGRRLLERPDRRVALALALRFGVGPGLLGAIALAGVAIPSAYVFQAAMPSGLTSLIIGRAYGLDQGLVATIIVWSTIAVLVVASAVYLA